MGLDPVGIREGPPKKVPCKLRPKEEWEAAEGAWGSIQKELGARWAWREACVCDGNEGAAHWAEDVAVEICVWKAFRGSMGDRPEGKRPEETSTEAGAGSKARDVFGTGEGRLLGGGVGSKKLEDWGDRSGP